MGVVLAVLVVAAATWALAGPEGDQTSTATTARGRFTVAQVQGKAVLLDTLSGDTWTLDQTVTGRDFAWLPVRKLNDAKDVKKWHAVKRALKQQMMKQKDPTRQFNFPAR
jgi:hypothetical protein